MKKTIWLKSLAGLTLGLSLAASALAQSFPQRPIVLVVLSVGLVVSIFQAATQIHEATLSFVPKLLAAFATLGLAGPWMLSTMVDYIREVLMSIPNVVG